MFAQEITVNGFKYEIKSSGDLEFIFTEKKGDVVIPEKVVYQGKSYTVTSLGYAAFANTDDIVSVTLPKTIITIGMDFMAESYVKKLVSLIECPSISQSRYFDESIPINNIQLFVPKGTKEKYLAIKGWKDFKSIEEIEDSQNDSNGSNRDTIQVTESSKVLEAEIRALGDKALNHISQASNAKSHDEMIKSLKQADELLVKILNTPNYETILPTDVVREKREQIQKMIDMINQMKK